MGHIAKECRLKKTTHEQTKASPMKCFKCGEHGHIAKFCKKQQKTEKMFVSQSKGTNQRGLQNSVEEQNLENEEEIFSFIQTSEDNLTNELILDSGATSQIIKDGNLFIEIDKEYSGTITNANSSKNLISGKGTVEIRVLDSNGSERKIRLSNAVHDPNNTQNLVSGSKLRATGKEVFFGRSLEIRTKNRTIFPFGERDSLFIWNNIDYQETSEQCNSGNRDPLSLRHKRLGHCNVEDIYKLKDLAVGLKLSEHNLTNCEICQLNKSKKLSVPKGS